MEEQGRIITVEEVVAMAKDKLMCIAVPAGLSRQIGLPIEEVIGLLQQVQDAWMRDELEAKAKAAQDGNQLVKLFPEEKGEDVTAEPVEEAEENADHGE